MAMGTMSVVAPIAALGVLVPVGCGLAQGEDPSAISSSGWWRRSRARWCSATRRARKSTGVARRSILLALIRPSASGGCFTLLDLAAIDRPGWTVVAAGAGGVVAVLGAVAARVPPLRGIPAVIAALIAIGALDILANSLFAVASTGGPFSRDRRGGSMYPALRRPRPPRSGRAARAPQRLGVVMALLGVGVIAAASASKRTAAGSWSEGVGLATIRAAASSSTC